MKKILITILCLCICFSLFGCNNNEQPDDTKPLVTNPTETTEPNDTNDNETLLSDIKFDKYIWEKELKTVQISTVKLNKDWDKYVVVGEKTISSTSITEISNLDNYFYTDRGLCGELEASYLTPKIGVTMESAFDSMDEDDCFYGQLLMMSTTYNFNSIVENVQFVGVPDIFVNNGLGHIAEQAPYTANEEFGIGSNMKYVQELIGAPTHTFDTTMEDGSSTTTFVYVGNDVELTLVFTWMTESGKDSGVVTSITWTPTTIKTELHTNIINDPLHGVVNDKETVDATIATEPEADTSSSEPPMNE